MVSITCSKNHDTIAPAEIDSSHYYGITSWWLHLGGDPPLY